MSKSSGFLWHDVPNRGGAVNVPVQERNAGDIELRSGWQADNSGNTAAPAVRSSGTNCFVAVPRARQNGQLVTGTVLARIRNQSGPDSKPLIVQSNPVPYVPTTLDTTRAVLKTHTKETVDGKVTEGTTIPSSDWAWARCSAVNPFPGTPIDINPENSPANLPLQICLKNGFDANLLYEVVYPATNAYVLGVGLAAFRDVGTFFRHATQDDSGTANPVAAAVKGAAIRGVSQSGNMVRQFIFMGMNQDEANRKVYDGAWPIIAGRRVAANARFAQPDGVLELYQMGSEGPQWWVDWPDTVRNLPAKSIFSRCNVNNTCPKTIEHFGSAEVYALKLTPEWVGTAGERHSAARNSAAITCRAHARWRRRRVQPCASQHDRRELPSQQLGRGTLPANPMPHAELVNVLRNAMRDWVLKGTPPPPSRWPTLTGGTLVDATKAAMGFPSGVPGIPDSIFLPANFAFPVFDYDWGPEYDRSEASGVPTKRRTEIPTEARKGRLRLMYLSVERLRKFRNDVGPPPSHSHALEDCSTSDANWTQRAPRPCALWMRQARTDIVPLHATGAATADWR